MNTPRNQSTVTNATEAKKSSAGAKEQLTEKLARNIALMIDNFPDSDIEVSWENVIRHTKLRFGRDFKRNVLSQKSWNGRKLIGEAYHAAKAIQKRRARDVAPKYDQAPRSKLRLVIAKLQSDNMALRDELERIRAQQYDEIHALLDTRTPLHQLVAGRAKDDPDDAGNSGPVRSA